MNILKKGDYWVWEYYIEYFSMPRKARKIVKELRKMGAK